MVNVSKSNGFVALCSARIARGHHYGNAFRRGLLPQLHIELVGLAPRILLTVAIAGIQNRVLLGVGCVLHDVSGGEISARSDTAIGAGHKIDGSVGRGGAGPFGIDVTFQVRR